MRPLSLALIRGAQRVLGDGPLARWLAASGVARLVRWQHDSRVLRRGSYEATLLERRARFVVTSRTQLAHIDALWRETPMLRRLVDTLREGDVAYDVGANIGLFSLAMAMNKRGVTVQAFEPEARNAAALRRNLQANAQDAVHVHEIALGDVSGEVPLYLDPEEGAGSHSLVRRAGLSDPVLVRQARIDDLAAELGPPAVVKIDVEGAEFSVLRGMERQLASRSVRALFLELHPAQLLAAGESVEALRQWLRARGYVSRWQARRGDEWHEHYGPGA